MLCCLHQRRNYGRRSIAEGMLNVGYFKQRFLIGVVNSEIIETNSVVKLRLLKHGAPASFLTFPVIASTEVEVVSGDGWQQPQFAFFVSDQSPDQ